MVGRSWLNCVAYDDYFLEVNRPIPAALLYPPALLYFVPFYD